MKRTLLLVGSLTALIAVGTPSRSQAQVAPATAVQPQAPAPPIEERNARDTQQRLQEMLRNYPPSLTRVLQLDPTLLLLDRLNNVVNSDFGKITYEDAIKELEKHNSEFQYPVHFGTDIQTEHEKYICEKIFGKPVFVTDYPKEIKAFYMKLNPDNKTVRAVDLLAPGIGEIVGGSQREDNLELLENRMHELGLKPEDYSWYMDLRKYGSAVHSGFGLGFERIIMYITGMQNIRDVIPFPRTPGNCDF
jgi:aspartyl/asparaginyl-tRNA synthetase